MGPMPVLAPLMFPIEIISHLSRIVSLSFRLFVDNTEVGLTTVEAKLLLLLILNQGKSIEQTQIEEFVHDGVSKTSNSTRSAIKRLKKKLPENIIHNSFNEGYFIKI
jgi:DNA-binding response OmpR family regulator